MFLVFVFMTVQTTVHLAAVSRGSAIALEAASRVARSTASCTEAAGWAEAQLTWGGVDAQCATTAEAISVRVVGPSPAGGLRLFGIVTNRATLDRTATVRIEQVQ